MSLRTRYFHSNGFVSHSFCVRRVRQTENKSQRRLIVASQSTHLKYILNVERFYAIFSSILKFKFILVYSRLLLSRTWNNRALDLRRWSAEPAASRSDTEMNSLSRSETKALVAFLLLRMSLIKAADWSTLNCQCLDTLETAFGNRACVLTGAAQRFLLGIN